MSTDVIFYTQIVSIVAFVAALFGLYRALVSQKDSTIELLREKNQFLADQLEQLKGQSPDALFESISRRYKAAVAEIERRDLEDSEKKRLQQEARKRAQREGESVIHEILARLRVAGEESDSLIGLVTRRHPAE